MDGYIVIGTKIDTTGIDQELAQLKPRLENRATTISNGVVKKFSLIKTGILGLGLGKIFNSIFNGIGSSISGAISRVDTLGSYSNVMSNLGISSEEASQSIGVLSDSLTEVPTRLDDASASVQRFTSSNGNIKASTEMYLALNNAILAGNAPTEIQTAAMEQLSQAYAKGKPDMMEWRTAMSAMPAQLKQVATAMGYVSADQLGEALRSGKVSMDEFMATVTRLNKEGVDGFQNFAEQAKNSTGGIQTSFANMQNAITRGVASIIDTIGRANIAAFFEGIRQAINAVIPYIVAFVKILMQAVGFVLGLFGKKLKTETKSTASSINSASGAVSDLNKNSAGTGKNLGKASKAAKQLNKELKQTATFDEMNILQDNRSSDGGTGAGGGAGGVGADFGSIIAPSLDLSGWDKQIKNKVAELNDYIMGAILGISGAIAAFKFAELLKKIGLIEKGLTGIKAVGIGAIIMGLYVAIKGLIKYLKDPSFENFGQIIQGIGVALAGLALIIGSIPVAAAAAIVLIVGTITRYWDKIKAFLQKGIDWLTGRSDWVYKHFGSVIGSIYDMLVRILSRILDALNNIFNGLKMMFDGVIQFITGVFTGNWKKAFDGLKKIFDGFISIITGTFKLAWSGLIEVLKTFINFVNNNVIKPIGNWFVNLWNKIKNGAIGAVNTVKNAFNGVVNFFKNIINNIVSGFRTIGTKVANAIGGAFKGVMNGVIRAVENMLNSPIKALNGLIGAINKIPGVKFDKLRTVKLPRLAKGGIINMPGRGVPIGGAIAGESGREGVIPLTDSQQMALLGEAIGKYININATVPVYVGNRQIAKEIKKINAEDDFAYNR